MGSKELEEQTKMFWRVSRCWNDRCNPLEGMITTEYAISKLTKIGNTCNSKRPLAAQASTLLEAVVDGSSTRKAKVR